MDISFALIRVLLKFNTFSSDSQGAANGTVQICLNMLAMLRTLVSSLSRAIPSPHTGFKNKIFSALSEPAKVENWKKINK